MNRIYNTLIMENIMSRIIIEVTRFPERLRYKLKTVMNGSAVWVKIHDPQTDKYIHRDFIEGSVVDIKKSVPLDNVIFVRFNNSHVKELIEEMGYSNCEVGKRVYLHLDYESNLLEIIDTDPDSMDS